MERTGSRPPQFSNIAARGDVQSSGMLKPHRKVKRMVVKGRTHSIAAKPDRVPSEARRGRL
jgi:hypothetical protein